MAAVDGNVVLDDGTCETPVMARVLSKKKGGTKQRVGCGRVCRSLEGLNAGDFQHVWNFEQLQVAWADQRPVSRVWPSWNDL